MTVKYITAGAILLTAAAYLAYAGMKDGWLNYHMPVDEFVANTQYHSHQVRLAGTVADENLTVGPGRLGAQFILKGQAQTLPVIYKGLLPDLFKAGSEVVVEGRLQAGIFQADLMMTKCASKYESAEHGKQADPGNDSKRAQ